jgi:zinc transport system permease protein
MVVAAVLSSLLTTVGLGISYGADLPAGATIVLLAAALYVVVNIASWLTRKRS